MLLPKTLNCTSHSACYRYLEAAKYCTSDIWGLTTEQPCSCVITAPNKLLKSFCRVWVTINLACLWIYWSKVTVFTLAFRDLAPRNSGTLALNPISRSKCTPGHPNCSHGKELMSSDTWILLSSSNLFLYNLNSAFEWNVKTHQFLWRGFLSWRWFKRERKAPVRQGNYHDIHQFYKAWTHIG